MSDPPSHIGQAAGRDSEPLTHWHYRKLKARLKRIERSEAANLTALAGLSFALGVLSVVLAVAVGLLL